MKAPLLLAIFFLCVLPSLLYGQTDSLERDRFNTPAIMYVGHFNPDCVPDTLLGYFSLKLRIEPAFICWGTLFDSTGSPLCDSSKYDARLKSSQHRDTTWIVPPKWKKLQFSVSVHQFNTNDSLLDLIFWTRGESLARVTSEGYELIDSIPENSTDSIVTVDTARSLVVFGHVDLSSRKDLDLAKVKSSQSRPYAAMELGYSRDLIKPQKRDNTRKTSWLMKKISKNVDSTETEDSTSAPPSQLAAVPDRTSKQPTAQVYPNPAIYSANLAIEPLPAGVYTVELVSAGGSVVSAYELSLQTEGEVLETLDLTTFPSGHYFVRVYNGVSSFGDYPIVIVR